VDSDGRLSLAESALNENVAIDPVETGFGLTIK